MPTASRADGSAHPEAGQGSLRASDVPGGAGGRAAGWRTPAGLTVIAVTAAGLALRALLLTRPGFLTSGNVEYDDGVYLGTAIRLLQGTLPYRDYAYVQPPGIVFLSVPFALAAKTVSGAAGLAAARVATAGASSACILLAGRLVRHKGVLVSLATCGFLALYPADVLTARTLLLEPWMNLFCLLAVNAAFTRGRLAAGRPRLLRAGILLGIAATVKFWAVVPAAVLLFAVGAGEDRLRRARWYLTALVAGFAVPVIALAAVSPVAFGHSTVADQISRTGPATPMVARLAYVTGLLPVIGWNGHLTYAGGQGTALAMGSNGTMVINGIGWAPYAVTGLGAAVLAVAYFRRRASRSPLEWFALAVAVLSTAAIIMYSAFYYHYPSFPAPWLALAFGTAAGAAAGAARRSARGRERTVLRLAVAGMAVAAIAAGSDEGSQLATQTAPPNPAAAARVIPPGSCVVADQVTFLLAADRIPPAGSGCPDIVDSMAETLILSGGVSVPGGAGNDPRVIAGWESAFGRARYVWLSSGYQTRLPWPGSLSTWFRQHYRLVRAFPAYGNSQLFERR